jgi:hypothetical protein
MVEAARADPAAAYVEATPYGLGGAANVPTEEFPPVVRVLGDRSTFTAAGRERRRWGAFLNGSLLNEPSQSQPQERLTSPPPLRPEAAPAVAEPGAASLAAAYATMPPLVRGEASYAAHWHAARTHLRRRVAGNAGHGDTSANVEVRSLRRVPVLRLSHFPATDLFKF